MYATERSEYLAKARAIIDRARVANRELTDTEQTEVQDAFKGVEELDAKSKAAADVRRRVMALGGPDREVDPEASGPVFNEETKAGITHAIKTRTSYRAQVDTKALLTTGSLLPTAGEGVQPGLHPNAYPLSSLFRAEAAAGPVIRFYRATAGSAAVVAEGAAKPDAGVAFVAVDMTLEKLAATAQFTDEMADDAPFLVGALQQELAAAVAQAENARILATFGGTSGVLTGTGAATDVVDLIADAIAGQEAISGLSPSAVIANPSVVATIRKAKASTAGVYVLDPTQPGPSTIHGVPVYATPATAAGTAWVVEATGVVVYRRGPLSVEVGTNADDFVHNIRTMRAEERVGTAVMRPTCLTKLTLT